MVICGTARGGCGARMPVEVFRRAAASGKGVACGGTGCPRSWSHAEVTTALSKLADKIDVCAGRHGGADTSVGAFKSTGSRHRDRQAVVDHVQAQGVNGATCDEIEVALGLSHQTASARVAELSRDGMLADSGARRKTRTGRPARVMVTASVIRTSP